MRIKTKKNINPKMFDVLPVDKDGALDVERMNGIKRTVVGKGINNQEGAIKSEKIFADIKQPDIEIEEARRFQNLVEQTEAKRVREYAAREPINEGIPVLYDFEPAVRIMPNNISALEEEIVPEEVSQPAPVYVAADEESDFFRNLQYSENYSDENKEVGLIDYNVPKTNEFAGIEEEEQFLRQSPSLLEELVLNYRWKPALVFAGVVGSVFLAIFGTNFVTEGMRIKDLALNNGKRAYIDLAQAKEEILNKNFQGSQSEFNEAFGRFEEISEDLRGFGGILVSTTRYVPYLSKLSTGAALAEAGKDISRAGVLFGQTMQTLEQFKNPSAESGDMESEAVSLLKIFQDTDKNIQEIQILLADAEENINKVNVDDLPEEQRVQFVELKKKLPEINKFLAAFVDNSHIFTDVLGGNGPRKYLFLFQNNQEMRATGGFIGTYGVLDIFNGRIRKFFIDGIFNPDGQLREKVVPPEPIQKVSAAWSLHDSNWFPDFPVSAEKATWFYEKTGGPTVDGVITMTPVVMQKLLEVTGPIEMPEYEVTIDKDNFVEKVQQEVEVEYDKELNQPKKILADLAPKILDKIFNAKNISDITKTMDILVESLNEKQILIYSKNYEIEKRLSQLGWSGEVLNTDKDYLSVINTNINGYKTDGMIEEKIEHKAELQADGSVIDSVTITRHHNGGNEEHDWWNRVNADYMRVYVPKGSQLLSAEGQTREFTAPPLDYAALGFKSDAQVRMEEDSMQIDEDSGTRIYEDAGKTVFANWTYVSPQETVVIKYKYLLPFKVSLEGENKIVDTYSLLVQKQSGSLGSDLKSEIYFPENYRINWKYPENFSRDGNNLKMDTNLKTDKFFGIAFTK